MRSVVAFVHLIRTRPLIALASLAKLGKLPWQGSALRSGGCMSRSRYRRAGAVILALTFITASPAYAQNASAEDLAWAHATLKTTLERAHEPLAGTGEWVEGDTKSVNYSGEGCNSTIIETYPAAREETETERRINIKWFDHNVSFNEDEEIDGRFVLWSNDWPVELQDGLPLYTGEDQIEPRVALSKLREVCSSFGRDESQYGSEQSQIDLLLEDTGFPLFDNGVQTDRWGSRAVIGTGCETFIELHYPEGDARAGSREWIYVVWNQVAPRIDPQFADFVIIDIGENPNFVYAGSADNARHLKAAMDELGAQCRQRYGEAETFAQPVEATASPPPPRLWPRPEPVVGIGWKTNHNDWSCQLYTELGPDRFVLLHYQKAQDLYYLWIWDQHRIAPGTRQADHLAVSISASQDKIELARTTAFFHGTRLIAPLGYGNTSKARSIFDLDKLPAIIVRSQAEGINARYSLPLLTMADLREFKACSEPYWNPPQDDPSSADDEPISE